jgi:hypothetical protein
MSVFRRGYAGNCQKPGRTARHREVYDMAPGLVIPGQRAFLLVVAGVGFEPT